MDHRTPPLRGFPLLAGLLTGSLVLALPSFAEQADTPHPSILAGVAALDRPVTYTETKIPLGELVQKVSVDTGVKLTAARDVADEPVAVVVKEFPARELLRQLADLLDYTWSKRSHESDLHYEIWQDLAAKQREEALRGARLATIEKRLQDQIEACAELSRLSDKEVQGVLEDDQKRIGELSRLPPEQQRKLLPPLSLNRSQFSFTEPRPLWEFLHLYAGFAYRWDRRGSLVRLRSRTWYLERPREIPLRLVRRWKAQFDRCAALPFEEYVRMPADLSELQWMNLNSLSQEPDLSALASDVAETRWGRHELRLFASLSLQQRRRMLQGRSIPLAQLTAAQRGLCLTALEELNRRWFPPLDLREAAGWSFGLTTRPMLRIKDRHGPFPTFREEPVPTPGAPGSPPSPGAPSGPPSATSQAARYPIWRVGLCFQTGRESRGVSNLPVALIR